METGWQSRWSGREHDAMSQTPTYLAKDEVKTLWEKAKKDTESSQDRPAYTAAFDEGAQYQKTYFADLQFVFSRVQHHFHKKTKKGYVPLPRACTSKGKGDKCKHDFPKLKQLTQAARVICRGNARVFGLRVKGRRNALGLTLSRRSCEWQSGTCPAFAAIFRSNSHTSPNYRLPPCPEYHDDEHCDKNCGQSDGSIRIISRLAQRAQRASTHYYCGYAFKRQPGGNYELKAIAQALNYVRMGMADKKVGAQWHRISSRVVQDLHHRSTVRPATEEVNLAANIHPHDVTAAEFIRTYRSKSFPGGRLIQREEQEREKASTTIARSALRMVQPKKLCERNAKDVYLRSFEDFYGYRGTDPRVYYLCPWEFTMLWSAEELPAPAKNAKASDGKENLRMDSLNIPQNKTCWVAAQPESGESKAGVHYRVNEALKDHPDYVVFPDIPVLQAVFRHTWVLRRNARPFVPQPAGTPMPERAPKREERSRLFSLYLRPWVLERLHATRQVPHISELDVVAPPKDMEQEPKRLRLQVKQARAAPPVRKSYVEAWSQYVRGGIVSRHAQILIKQFLSTSCGRSEEQTDEALPRTRDLDENERQTKNDMNLEEVHSIINDMNSAKSKDLGLGDEPNTTKKPQHSTELGSRLWSLESQTWSDVAVNTTGLLSDVDVAAEGNRSQDTAQTDACNASKQALLKQKVYIRLTKRASQEWLRKVGLETPAPQGAQLDYLKRIIDRCEREAAELHGQVPKSERNSEPSREFLLGPPGAGRSPSFNVRRPTLIE